MAFHPYCRECQTWHPENKHVADQQKSIEDSAERCSESAQRAISQDEDVVRTIARMLAGHGWFINVQASRINEHFTVSECPKAGWALAKIRAHDAAMAASGNPHGDSHAE